jgi:hypothetical protein
MSHRFFDDVGFPPCCGVREVGRGTGTQVRPSARRPEIGAARPLLTGSATR